MPPWPRPAQRILWIVASLVFLTATLMAVREEDGGRLPPREQDDPRLDLRIDLNRATAVDLEALP